MPVCEPVVRLATRFAAGTRSNIKEWTMNDIQNFAFEEHLVRVVEQGGEPWFVGKDVCGALAIKNHNDALSDLDEDEKGVAITDPLYATERGGGAQEVIIVSEPGVYRLVFRSRKPEAERFKRWLAHDVLPTLRRTGVYAVPEQGRAEDGEAPNLLRDAPLAARVDAVRLARVLFGTDRARGLWEQVGLPPVPDAPLRERSGETVHLLRMLLNHEIAGVTVRRLILESIDGVEDATSWLDHLGVKPDSDGEGYHVANVAQGVRDLFRRSPWEETWRLVLRRVPGAVTGGREVIGGVRTRTTWLPLSTLDDNGGLPH